MPPSRAYCSSLRAATAVRGSAAVPASHGTRASPTPRPQNKTPPYPGAARLCPPTMTSLPDNDTDATTRLRLTNSFLPTPDLPLTYHDCQDQSHCLLLVEPVLLPHLGHTGVTRETLPGDRPLFYPNGHKKHGLGATVRSTLYQSTSAPTLSVGTQNSCNGRQQQPPSDWAGSSAYFSLSENSSTGRSEVSAAIPAGQGGMFPTDVWGPPPTGGGTRSRTAAEWSTGCSTNVGRRTGSRKAGTGEAKRAVSRSSTTSQQKGEEFQAQQQQHDFESSTSPNQAPSEPQTSIASRTALSGLRVTPDRTGPTGFDAAGRDSEWLVERRAADQEARELLCALKHNNTRLWYLVGGRV